MSKQDNDNNDSRMSDFLIIVGLFQNTYDLDHQMYLVDSRKAAGVYLWAFFLTGGQLIATMKDFQRP